MASAAEQLSLKNQMPSNLPANKAAEGFSTAQYAMLSFNEPPTSPDTTIPKDVPAESQHKLKEEDEDKKDGEKLDEMEFDLDIDSMLDEEDDDAEKKIDEAADSDDDKEKVNEADDKDGDKLDESDDKDDDDKKVNESDDKDDDDKKKMDEAEKRGPPDDKLDEADDKDADDKEKVNESDDKDADDKKLDEEEKKDDLDEAFVFPKIRMKISLTEEANQLLAEDKNLTDEQKRQARALFESTMRGAAKKIGSALNREYRKVFTEQRAKMQQKMVGQVDAYLTYVAEQWAEQNKAVIKNNIRVELAEDFMAGLHALFTENYVSVPDSKVDVVKQLQGQVKNLTEKFNASEAAAAKLHTKHRAELTDRNKALVNEHKARLIAEACVGLPDTDRAKVQARAKELPFTKSAAFRSDLGVLVESVTGKKRPVTPKSSMIPAEAEVLAENKQDPSKKAPARTQVDQYVSAADRLVGKQ